MWLDKAKTPMKACILLSGVGWSVTWLPEDGLTHEQKF